MRRLKPASILPVPASAKIRPLKEKSRFSAAIDRFGTDQAIPLPEAYEAARANRGQNISQEAAAMATP